MVHSSWICFLLLLVLSLSPRLLPCHAQGAGRQASVSSNDDFMAALIDTRVTKIILRNDLQLDADAWRSFYSRSSPFVLTHNLTITSDPPYSKLDFAWTGDKRVRLAPGAMLNVSGVVLQRSRYGPGVQLDFLAYSPGSYLVLSNTVMLKLACITTTSEPDAVAVQPRLPGFPGVQSAQYISPYCLRGTCYNNVLQYIDYTRLTSQNTEDTAAGGYAMVMSNFTKVCLNFINGTGCSYTDSIEVCLQDTLDRFNTGPPFTPHQLEVAAAAAAGAHQQQVTRLIAGLVAGLVGGALLLLLLLGLLLVLKQRRRLLQRQGLGWDSKQQPGLSLPVVAAPSNTPRSDSLQLLGAGQKHVADLFTYPKAAAAAAGSDGSGGTPNSHSCWELAACKTSERFAVVAQYQQQQQQPQQPQLRRYSSSELQHVQIPQTPGGNATSAAPAAAAIRSSASGSMISPSSVHDLSTASAISGTDKISLGVLLGAGSFGRVFKGRCRGMDVAVKVLQHSQAAAAAVANEVNLMMSFQHPNIVAAHHFVTWRKRHAKHKPSDAMAEVSDPGTAVQQHSYAEMPCAGPDAQVGLGAGPSGEFHEDTQTWIVQEFCDAGNLGEFALAQRQRKHPGRLPEAHNMLRLLFRLREVAEGMEYLHRCSVVHGDLKSSNVLLSVSPASPYGRLAKITDFGVSRALGTNETHCSTHTLGTVSHMAPELLRYGKMSTAVDVFSFGILMWELLTGSVPWQGLHYGSIIERVALLGDRPPVPAGTPEDYDLLMCSCWNSSPEQRPEFGQVIKCLDIMIASRQHELAELQHASSTADSQLAAAAAATAASGAVGTGGSETTKPYSSAAEVHDLDSGRAAVSLFANRSHHSSSRSNFGSLAAGPAVSGSRLLMQPAAAANDAWMCGPYGPQDL